jgi:hypothetical protein
MAGRPGPFVQTRQPPPGGQPEEGVAAPLDEVLANTDSWRSTRLLPQLGQAIVFVPALTGCSFWKSWRQSWQRYS